MSSIFDRRIIVDGEPLNPIELLVATEIEMRPNGVVHHHKYSEGLKELIRQICREEIAKTLTEIVNAEPRK